jgi:regulator of protease activity HflC (stomatin/prohibitin superfamily)
MNREGFAFACACGVFTVVLFLFAAWFFCFTQIPAGHVGLVTTFGSLSENVLDEGLHFVAPWKGVYKFSLQTQEDSDKAQAPTKEGLSVNLEATLLYRVQKSSAADIYRTVGPTFKKILVESQFKSALRGATTHYEAKDLYTANREKIEEAILEAVKHSLAERGVLAEKVLLRNVEVPQAVKEMVEAKVAAEQDAQRMEFVLKKESQEAERKRLEAKGIADAQAIIKKDLDPHYLTYLWIEALKEGAKHNNAVIYIPTGTDGMPMFKEIKTKGK